MMVAAYGVTTRQVIAQDKEMRVDDDGSVVVRDWAVGFALGIGLRAKETRGPKLERRRPSSPVGPPYAGGHESRRGFMLVTTS